MASEPDWAALQRAWDRLAAAGAKLLAKGTPVSWPYRSATGHGYVDGVAKEADTSADTEYNVRQVDHHPGEPEVVKHYGRVLTVVSKAEVEKAAKKAKKKAAKAASRAPGAWPR